MNERTYNQRMDRNWGEILQELRITQSGTQILTGFLLAIAFQPKFGDLDAFQHAAYLVLVVLAGLTTTMGLAPVLLHRELFRRKMKDTVVRVADIFLRCALAGVGLVLTGTQLLIFDVTVNRHAGLIAASATLAVVTAVALLSRILRARRR